LGDRALGLRSWGLGGGFGAIFCLSWAKLHRIIKERVGQVGRQLYIIIYSRNAGRIQDPPRPQRTAYAPCEANPLDWALTQRRLWATPSLVRVPARPGGLGGGAFWFGSPASHHVIPISGMYRRAHDSARRFQQLGRRGPLEAGLLGFPTALGFHPCPP
jgi:hypothetical protein